MAGQPLDQHTLAVLVENRPGVLARIAGMFSRRSYNIHSLAVGPTDDDRVSRLTIVVGTDPVHLEQVIKQLNKLVHVLKIIELEAADSVQMELQMVKVGADESRRADLFALADVFGAEVVDVDADTVTLAIAGNTGRLGRLMPLLAAYGIREMVRSGQVAIARGDRSMTDGSKLRLQRVV